MTMTMMIMMTMTMAMTMMPGLHYDLAGALGHLNHFHKFGPLSPPLLGGPRLPIPSSLSSLHRYKHHHLQCHNRQ